MKIRLHVTEPTEVDIDGVNQIIKPNIYIVDNEKFCKENNFMKCSKCGEYFDTINEFGQYHDLYEENIDKQYCESCFNSIA
jgi:hypothetical protein